MAKRVLKGKRIRALAAEGFERVELTIPMKTLKLAGAKADVISLREGSVRGVKLTSLPGVLKRRQPPAAVGDDSRKDARQHRNHGAHS